MSAPKITREVSRDAGRVRYVHTFCSACRYWHGFSWTLEGAYEPAERHLVNVHDVDPRVASTARRVAESKKRAAESPAADVD